MYTSNSEWSELDSQLTWKVTNCCHPMVSTEPEKEHVYSGLGWPLFKETYRPTDKRESQLKEKLKMKQIYPKMPPWETLCLSDRAETLVSFSVPMQPATFHFTSQDFPFYEVTRVYFCSLQSRIPKEKSQTRLDKFQEYRSHFYFL